MRYGGSALGLGGLAITVVLLLVASCVTWPDAADDEGEADAFFGGQQIDWTACYDQTEIEGFADRGGDRDRLADLECGTVTVPVDYHYPDRATLDLGVVRAPAEGSAQEYKGSLVLNPGGPGAEGTRMLDLPVFSDDIRDSFDLVSFDPRGVGESGGFACGNWYAIDDARQRVAEADPAELDTADLQPLAEAAQRYAQTCAEAVGEEFLANIGTVNVARDLDVIRDALGDERLSFVGYSYGTHIGALYAEMFPENTRALVLDGAVETEQSNTEIALDQTAALQDTWELFVATCVNETDACPFTGVDGAEERMVGILEQLDRDPLHVDGVPINGDMLFMMFNMELYYEDSWDHLAGLLTAIDADEPEAIDHHLGLLYDNTFGVYHEQDPREEEVDPALEHQDGHAVFTAVNCADRNDPTDVAAYRDAAAGAAQESPLFGSALVWEQLPCAYWPDTEQAPTGFTASDAPPIVVIGTLTDPATPYAWSQELAAQLDPAVLLTYEGTGHTLYGEDRSACVDAQADAYLLTGELPENGETCPRGE